MWVYAEDVYRFVPSNTWDKFSLVFPYVWTASAFKGAFGETMYVPNAKRHLENNLNWLELMSNEGALFKGGFRGIVITGWQRLVNTKGIFFFVGIKFTGVAPFYSKKYVFNKYIINNLDQKCFKINNLQ